MRCLRLIAWRALLESANMLAKNELVRLKDMLERFEEIPLEIRHWQGWDCLGVRSVLQKTFKMAGYRKFGPGELKR